MIFVFGSNLAGIHGAGAAQYAYKHEGAIWREGIGLHGNSYAIPTKDWDIRKLPLEDVQHYVTMFILFALLHRQETFKITQIGCGLAGFKPHEIAPMFKDAPDNCHFDRAWQPWLDTPTKQYKYWGTF